MFETSIYIKRRQALVTALQEQAVCSGLLLFPGNRQSPINYPDNYYQFRQDSSFLYYFGIAEADLAAVIDLSSAKAVLFADDTSMDSLIWTGPSPSAEGLRLLCGADAVKPRADFAAFAGSFADAQKSALHFLPPYRAETAIELAEILKVAVADIPGKASIDFIKAVIAQREIKEDIELMEIELAVSITRDMHRAVMAAIKPGLKEAQLLAEAYKVAYGSGGMPSFPAIATSRGAVLHNHSYSHTLRDGGLFLLDAGAESPRAYAGDLTSTMPVSGRFSDRQKAVYEIVLKAGAAAARALKPMQAFRNAHIAAAVTIVDGLKDLGLMKGDSREAVAGGAYACFFPHGVGHQMGLDVHDMEGLGEDLVGYGSEKRSGIFGLKSLRLAKPIKPNMVFTIEPGIYFIKGLIEAWKSEKRHEAFINYKELEHWLDFGGIRNEENWVCTESGIRRLGPSFDKSIAAIEEACNRSL